MHVPWLLLGLTLLLAVACTRGDGSPDASPSPSPTATEADADAAPTLDPTRAATATAGEPAPTTTPTASSPTAVPSIAGPVTARVLTAGVLVYASAGTKYFVVGELPAGAEVTVIGRLPRKEWLAIADAGWVLYDEAALDLGVELDAIGGPPLDAQGYFAIVGPPPHPDATRAGVPGVDAVIAAMHAQDPDAMAALLTIQEVPCTQGSDAGGPPDCRPGDPPGTLMRVVPFSSSESAWMDPERAVELIRSLAAGRTARDPFRVYAAFAAEGSAEAPAGYRVVFTQVGSGQAAIFGVTDDGVTSISVPRDGPIGGGTVVPAAAGFEFLLRPPVPAGLLPPP